MRVCVQQQQRRRQIDEVILSQIDGLCTLLATAVQATGQFCGFCTAHQYVNSNQCWLEPEMGPRNLVEKSLALYFAYSLALSVCVSSSEPVPVTVSAILIDIALAVGADR